MCAQVVLVCAFIYKIFDMNVRSGSHALVHVEKSKKSGVLRVLHILHVRL